MSSNGQKEFVLEPKHLETLKSLIEDNKDQVWSIIVAQVDPDGLGTALVLKEVLQHLGAEALIYYGGQFSHPQNEMIWNLFQLEKHMRPLAELPDNGPVALADSCKLEDSRFGHQKITAERFKLIVDHHRDNPVPGNGRFIYIVSCGAAATLAHRLANAAEAPVSEDASTLAAIGILSDTDRMTSFSTHPLDYQALAQLMAHGDQKKLAECFNYDLPIRYYEMQSQCLENQDIVGSYLITQPNGLLTEKEDDFLGIIADELRQREGIKTAIVWGVTRTGLRASIRTKSMELNINTFITEMFGKGSGGGKHGSGGAWIPLEEPTTPTKGTVKHLILFYEARFLEKLEARVGSKKADKDSKGKKADS